MFPLSNNKHSHRILANIKLILFSILVIGITNGCTQKQKNGLDQTKNPLAHDLQIALSNIGVMPPRVRGSYTSIHMHKKERLQSIGNGAANGGTSVLLVSDPSFIIFLPIGVAVGAVVGAIKPHKVAVVPTEAQLESFRKSVEGALLSFDSEERHLQDIFITESNKYTSKKFFPISIAREDTIASDDYMDKDMPRSDAMLHSYVKNIRLSGYASDDPKLSIEVDLRFSLISSGKPKQCLGWYGDIWKGKARSLSEWTNNNGHYLKEDIIAAYKDTYLQAVIYLFNASNRQEKVNGRTDTSSLSYCNIPDSQHILDEAAWFCPQADKGIADPQRRIGDVLYYGNSENEKRDLVRAYVWYSLAAKGNNSEAEIRLIELESQLSSEQLQEAKRRLELWKPGQCMNDLIEAGLILPGH